MNRAGQPLFMKTYGKQKRKLEAWISPDNRKQVFDTTSSSDLSIAEPSNPKPPAKRGRKTSTADGSRATRLAKSNALSCLREKDSDEENIFIVPPPPPPPHTQQQSNNADSPTPGKFVTHRRGATTAKHKAPKRKLRVLLAQLSSNSSDDFVHDGREEGGVVQRAFPCRAKQGRRRALANADSSLADPGNSGVVTNGYGFLRDISLNDSPERPSGPCHRKPLFSSTPSSRSLRPPISPSASDVISLSAAREELAVQRTPLRPSPSASLADPRPGQRQLSSLCREVGPEVGNCEGSTSVRSNRSRNGDSAIQDGVGEQLSLSLFSAVACERTGSGTAGEETEDGSHFVSATTAGRDWLAEVVKERCLTRRCVVRLEREYKLHRDATYSSCVDPTRSRYDGGSVDHSVIRDPSRGDAGSANEGRSVDRAVIRDPSRGDAESANEGRSVDRAVIRDPSRGDAGSANEGRPRSQGQSRPLKTTFPRTVSSLKTTFPRTVSSLKTTFPRTVSSLKTTFPRTVSSLKTTFPRTVSSLKTTFPRTVSSLKTTFPRTVSSLKTTFPRTVSSLKTTFPRTVSVPKDHVPKDSLVPKDHVPKDSLVPKDHVPKDSLVPKDHVPKDSLVPKGNVPKDSLVPKDHVPKDSLVPKDHVPKDSLVPKDHVPKDSLVPKDHVPKDSLVPKDHVPKDSLVPKDHVPKDSLVPKGNVPKDSLVPKDHVPKDSLVPKDHVPKDSLVPKDHVPKDSLVPKDHVPKENPHRRKMGGVPKERKRRSVSRERPATGRKVCVSGVSLSRWGRRDGPPTGRAAPPPGRAGDCSITELLSAQHTRKVSSLSDSIVLWTPGNSVHLSSLLGTPDTHTWSRLKAALSLHRKTKAFLTPNRLPRYLLSSPEAELGAGLGAELGDISQKLFSTPRPPNRRPQIRRSTPLSVYPGSELSDEQKVYSECNQTGPRSFQDCLPAARMKLCRKVGEGAFGEVFSTTNSSGDAVALKIIPVEGCDRVNGEEQKTFGEILHEIIISKELSSLKEKKQNQTTGFIGLKDLHCVQGCYPPGLLKAWDSFKTQRGSENDRPDFFSEDQLFLILEFEFGGSDLENSNGQLASVMVAQSILHQVTAALAVAEQELCFEHRDLHWGNVLVQSSKEKEASFLLDGTNHSLETRGVSVRIIDYSLSRLEIDGLTVSCDISADEELFQGRGDYQFDIYRLMRQENGNVWGDYQPHSNVLWLHYLSSKLLTMTYKGRGWRGVKQARLDLQRFHDNVLAFRSASDVLYNCGLFQ
ncbi:uncharacterized protein [Salmo salar]|uniref:non-specific serine/threonine protein kinase n=1 Tax=Salmo salar TaxID=8030 RepID=A0ABM3E7V4_SALSA|nr:uncharacterized protein LOC123724012 [Salmo salar]